ncbi:hypothetical protein NDU88_007738 [Pleurodeles waltl]|uniref:Uncharacterized protein n=1 Tax=Pleurodeles waltl TaxID=8319 RepID=A0AAV7N2Y3_PLEWA|nr:hypothetical protein NDU88_007738 [Pleurodeles waltl]
MGTGLRGVSSKLKIGDRGGTALSPKSAAPFWAPIALFIWGGGPGLSSPFILSLSFFQEGAASFLGGRTWGPRATHLTPVVRDQRTGVQSHRSTAPYPAQARLQGQVQAPPVSRAVRSPAAVFLAGRPLSRGPAAPVRIRLGSPRPRAHPLRASPLSPEPGATEPESPRTNEAGRVAPLPAGGPRSQPAPGTSRAAHGTRIGGGPVSGRAPIPGLAETPLARPPSLGTYRSGRGQRSRLGLRRHRYRRYLRGPGARGNG